MFTLITTIPLLSSKQKVTVKLTSANPVVVLEKGGKEMTRPLTKVSQNKVIIGKEFQGQLLVKGFVLLQDPQNKPLIGYYVDKDFYTVGISVDKFKEFATSVTHTSIGKVYNGFTATQRIRLGSLWLLGFPVPKNGEAYPSSLLEFSKKHMIDHFTGDAALSQFSNPDLITVMREVDSWVCGIVITNDSRTLLVIAKQEKVLDVTDIIGYPAEPEKKATPTNQTPKRVKEYIPVSPLPHRKDNTWVSPIVDQNEFDKMINHATYVRSYENSPKVITHQKANKRKHGGLYVVQNHGEYGRFLIKLHTTTNLKSMLAGKPALKLRGSTYEILYISTDLLAIYIRQLNNGTVTETTPTSESVEQPDLGLVQRDDTVTGEVVNGTVTESTAEQPEVVSTKPESILDLLAENLIAEETKPAEFNTEASTQAIEQVGHDTTSIGVSDVNDHQFKPAKAEATLLPEWLVKTFQTPKIEDLQNIALTKIVLFSNDNVLFQLPEPYGNRVIWTDVTDLLIGKYALKNNQFISFMNMTFYRCDNRTYAAEMHIRLSNSAPVLGTAEAIYTHLEEVLQLAKTNGISEANVLEFVSRTLYK